MSTIEQTGSLASTATPPYTDAIDVHHHIVPRFYLQALLDGGVDSPIAGVEYPEWSAESSLELMQHQGIATAMVSLSVPGVGLPDPQMARRLARQVNEYMAELVASHSGRFGAFAAVPLPDLDAALEETAYALDELGLDGVGLFTNYGRVYLGDASLDPMLAEIARRGTVAFVHPAAPHPQGRPHVDLPDSVCEFPFATTRMAAQLLYNGTFGRYPGLRLILPHAGGAIPYLAERLTFAPVIRPSMAGQEPADPLGILRSLYFDTAMSGNAWTVPALRAFADSGHILIGTDYPFMPEWSSTRNGHQLLRSAAFTEQERRGVFRGNAEALFPRLARKEPETSS